MRGRAKASGGGEEHEIAQNIASKGDARAEMREDDSGKRRAGEEAELGIGRGHRDRRGEPLRRDETRQEAKGRGHAEGVDHAMKQREAAEPAERQLSREGEQGKRERMQGRQRISEHENAEAVVAVGDDAAERRE